MISLRQENTTDLPFLRELYASTREEELAHVSWSNEDKQRFLDQQFQAQRHHYYSPAYTGSTYEIILEDGVAVGRLYVLVSAVEVRIIDIALIPSARGRGTGGTLLRSILAKGKALGLPTTIHVEKNNPALSLYTRLGFIIDADREAYWFLKALP